MAILSNINGLFAVEDNGAIKFNNLTGTNNQVLIANTNSSPTWVNVDTIIGGPYLPLTGGTLAGAGNLVVGGTLTVNGIGTFNTPAGGVAFNLDAAADNYGTFRLRTNGNTNKWDIGMKNDNDFYIYNQATSAQAFEIDTANNNATFAGDIELAANLFSTGQNLKFHAAGTHVMNIDINGKVYPNINNAYDLGHSTGLAWRNLFLSGSATIPTMAGNPDFIGDIYQYGRIFRNASFIDVVGNRNSKIELETAYFTHTVSNQAVNIQFPNVAMQGYYKITLSGSYSHQDISGKLTKVIPFGYNPNGSIWRTGNSQSEITIATGGVSTNFTIGNLAWDSTNSKFIVPIYKLTSTGNSVRILIEYFGAAANNLKDVNLSSNYTQTAPSPFNVRQYQNIRDRLGIGTASPNKALTVYGGNDNGIWIDSQGAQYTSLAFGHNGTEKANIAWDNTNGYTNISTYANGHLAMSTGGSINAFLNSSGNFGIGTTSPSVKFQVQQDQAAESNVMFINNSTSAGAAMRLTLNVGNPAGNDPMISFNIGDGGFDWTMGVDNSDSDKFKISGGTDSHNPNLGTNDRLTIDSSGTLTMSGDVVAYSDERLKSNIKTLDGSKVLKMRGVSFEKEGKKGSGVIAQELEKVAPELVNNDNEYKGVAYGNLTGYLIEAIKELEARIKELENK